MQPGLILQLEVTDVGMALSTISGETTLRGPLQPELFCDFVLTFSIMLTKYYFTCQGCLEYLGHNPK